MAAPNLGYKKRVSIDGTIIPEMEASITHDGETVEYTNGVSLDAQGMKAFLVGLIDWACSISGKLGAKAGYLTDVNEAGTSTSMTDEAMEVVSGKTYRVTAEAKRLFDEDVALTFKDATVAINSSNIQEIDYLNGQVTFTSGYTVNGSITVSGNYIPLTALAEAKGFELSLTGDVQDATTYASAQASNGTRRNAVGLIEATLSLDRLEDLSGDLLAALKARVPLLIEIKPADGLARFRGWWLPSSVNPSASKSDIEMEAVEFQLAGTKTQNFGYLASASFNDGLTALFDNFFARTSVALQYLPDGADGYEGDAYVSSIGMSGDVEGVDEFTSELVSAGELTAVA